MNIGVIGSGNIGATVAGLFAGAGHGVVVSNSRGPETLAGLVEEIGPGVRAGTVGEAAEFGDVVVEAIPFGRYESLPAEKLAGKVFVSASNYYPARDGEVDHGGSASSELVQRHLPGARVVKAFNTIHFERLKRNGRPGAPVEEREAVFVAGDDEEAKGIVSALIEEIGFASVDTGTLAESRRQEPGSPVYNVPMKPAEAREALAEMG